MASYKKLNFICFTGIDGSGKTTQAKLLVNELRDKGYDYEYRYSRFRPIIAKGFVAIARFLFLRKTSAGNYKESTVRKKSLSRLRPLVILYEFIMMFDCFLQMVPKIRMPLLMRRNIVCDRYFYDTLLTDIAIDMDYSDKQLENKLRKYRWFFPAPKLLFIIDLPADMAFQRKNDVSCPDYLVDRRPLYLNLAKYFKVAIIDGSKDLSEVQAEIQTRLSQVESQ